MKLVVKKLGRHRVNGKQVDGLADIDEKKIYVDSRTDKKYHLYLIIHEQLHILNWDWEEGKVIAQARKISNLLWKLKFRKCDT